METIKFNFKFTPNQFSSNFVQTHGYIENIQKYDEYMIPMIKYSIFIIISKSNYHFFFFF